MTKSESMELIKNDLVQVTDTNPEEVAEIVKEAIGNLPLREFGAKADMSASTLSRIINGKIQKPLSIETVFNIAINTETDIENEPALLLRLARANGMMSRAEQTALQNRMVYNRKRDELHSTCKELISTIILARLAERGVMLKAEDEGINPVTGAGFLKNISDDGLKYDYRFNVSSNNESYSWVMLALTQSEKEYPGGSFNPKSLAGRLVRELSPVFVTDSWTPEVYSGTKISLCFISREFFECFCSLLNSARLNNRFSAILIDRESLTVKEEKMFNSALYPESESLFDIKPMISAGKEADDAADENNGDDFLTFTGNEEESI